MREWRYKREWERESWDIKGNERVEIRKWMSVCELVKMTAFNVSIAEHLFNVTTERKSF